MTEAFAAERAELHSSHWGVTQLHDNDDGPAPSRGPGRRACDVLRRQAEISCCRR